MLTAKQLGKQLILILIIGLISIATFNIITDYYATKKNIESDVLDKLHAIARTSSLAIDGSNHELLIKKFPKIQDSTLAHSDPEFRKIVNVLTKIKNVNNLETNIYTLFFDKDSLSVGSLGHISFGVFSGQNQYFREKYEIHPELLRENFNKGGILPEYKTASGVWLSAFSPILDRKGQTVAVIQVDQRVDLFLDKVRKKSLISALISLSIISLVSFIMIFFVKKMVKNDKKKTQTIEITSNELKAQNIKITDSINYAQRIQNSIIPQEKELQQHYEKSFILFKPKDIVSGDFPWVYRSKNSLYFSALDCTGHGVPGAMMSFVGYFLLEKIIQKNPNERSCDLIQRLHKQVNTTLKQDINSNHNHDGMDGAMCKIIQETNTLCFSGAHRPLYLVRNGELEIFKGARRGIGGTQYEDSNRSFSHKLIPLEEKDRLFIFSDGYVDQFGGPEQRKLGAKKLQSILCQNLPMNEIKQSLNLELIKWKGQTDQTDDILVMGVQI